MVTCKVLALLESIIADDNEMLSRDDILETGIATILLGGSALLKTLLLDNVVGGTKVLKSTDPLVGACNLVVTF